MPLKTESNLNKLTLTSLEIPNTEENVNTTNLKLFIPPLDKLKFLPSTKPNPSLKLPPKTPLPSKLLPEIFTSNYILLELSILINAPPP